MNSLITNKTQEDIVLTVPAHVSWSFNDVIFGEIENKKNTVFKFNYTFDIHKKPEVDLRQAIRNSLINIYTVSKKKFAVCVSGADSEIIARECKFLGIPFEIFFLDIWGINSISREKVKSLAAELDAKCNILTLDKSTAYNDVIPKNYIELQAEKPTYLCLPYLFDNISTDFFIIGGEGDPQKSGPDYEPFCENGVYPGLPISSTEVWYRQWALKNNRQCEMYFYASSPDIITSYFNHSLLENNNGKIDTRFVVDSLFDNLIFGYKTTNWEDKTIENYNVRMFVRNFNKGHELNFQPSVFLIR